MTYALTALFLSFAAGTGTSPEAELMWHRGLTAACAQAGNEGKLVLLRQVLCACAEETCPSLRAARRPAYLQDPVVRRLIRERMVLAVSHVAPERAGEGLYHPSYAPAGFRRWPTGVRTVFVTPTRHVIHRLDLCPKAHDVAAEIAFALIVRKRCYSPLWVPRDDNEDGIFALHFDHAENPADWHRAIAKASAGTAEAADIAWHKNLDKARARARDTGKLLLHFQIVGDLDGPC